MSDNSFAEHIFLILQNAQKKDVSIDYFRVYYVNLIIKRKLLTQKK